MPGLATRLLEQSILESAGYQVELATSAEEALVKARQCSHGLFVVDVEMPGMNGFEFVEHTRADPRLGHDCRRSGSADRLPALARYSTVDGRRQRRSGIDD